MITTSEENAVKLSATKKDFYQIWNELLDTASKISERWDPTSTNESDPGIVLLKVLTAIADKLNFEVDANTLEAFMPSAAQEESMRKLTEMMGYNMKYYQSATTNVQITYNTYDHTEIPADGTEVTIDKFTNIVPYLSSKGNSGPRYNSSYLTLFFNSVVFPLLYLLSPNLFKRFYA